MEGKLQITTIIMVGVVLFIILKLQIEPWAIDLFCEGFKCLPE